MPDLPAGARCGYPPGNSATTWVLTIAVKPFVVFTYSTKIFPHFNAVIPGNGNTNLVVNNNGTQGSSSDRLYYSEALTGKLVSV